MDVGTALTSSPRSERPGAGIAGSVSNCPEAPHAQLGTQHAPEPVVTDTWLPRVAPEVLT